MKVFAENKGWITLEPRHQMASGGEGTVYAREEAAFKVYHERRDLADKIRLLQAIDHPGVIAPRGVLRDDTDRFVGYWMNRAAGEALPNLFATGWRQDNRFGLRETVATVEGMREVVSFAHRRGALLVDANEFNWLVALGAAGKAKPQPLALDVDSWQVGPYPATAIMPSIRDWNAAAFSEKSDWYSWAVVTFQLFTGIHPYKGTHPRYGKGQLDARMKANASVFDTGVRLNSAVRDLASIPKGLNAWYRAVFQDGYRGLPPEQFGAATTPSMRTVFAESRDARITISRLGELPARNAALQAAVGTLRYDRLVVLGGKLFAVVPDSDRGLVELDSSGYVRAQWPVIANSTTFFRTGALSSYLGQPYLLAVGETVSIFPAPFLKGAGKIVDVFTEGGKFALVLATDTKTGVTSRFEARLRGAVWEFAERVDTDETFINAAGTGTGVVAHIPENGVLVVYSVREPRARRIRSPLIKAEMVLEEFESKIVFRERDQVFRFQLN